MSQTQTEAFPAPAKSGNDSLDTVVQEAIGLGRYQCLNSIMDIREELSMIDDLHEYKRRFLISMLALQETWKAQKRA